jgi:ornithine carbamoyltransferase
MLADILTMTDHSSTPLAEMSFCYLGDGRNNTANSLLVTGTRGDKSVQTGRASGGTHHCVYFSSKYEG